MAAGPGWGGGEAGAADQAGGAAEGRATGRRQKAGLQEGGRRLLRGHRILLKRQVDTET